MKCSECGHDVIHHFKTEDSLGKWSFCMISTCSCFVDDRNEESPDKESEEVLDRPE